MIIDNEIEKNCSICNKIKLNSLFIKNRNICIDCNNIIRRTKYQNDEDFRKKLIQHSTEFKQKIIIEKNNKKIEVYFDQHIANRKLSGERFQKIAQEIISHLPEHVYISFDIDGLDPRFCPNTGTPVPGGLDYHEVMFIINELVKSNKKLVGFDLVEVAPNLKDKTNEWDANVAMRLLYKMASASLATMGYIKKRS